MKVVVITGSTRGIGFGLADAFLARGCVVVISGRSQAGVDAGLAALQARHEAAWILGQPCQVTDFAQVQALWAASVAHFGKVDIWINNAGIGGPQLPFWENDPALIKTVVSTNLTGTMYGSQVAIKGMLAQGFGSLYNMEGLGSDGRRVAGLTLYGSTKYGIRYLNQALVAETKGMPLLVGSLSPGMVITEMITGQYKDRPEEWERAKRIFNILADRVETVTPWLADSILANRRHGARIAWLNPAKIAFRFLSAPFRRRDIFTERR